MRLLKTDAAHEERKNTCRVESEEQLGEAELRRLVGQNDVAGGDEPHSAGIGLPANMGNRDKRTGGQAQPQVIERSRTVVLAARRLPAVGEGLEVGAVTEHFRR